MADKQVVANLISGAVAGAATESVLFPIDTLKTRMQAARVRGELTVRAAYRGISVLPASMLATGAFFTVYERVKTEFLQRRNKDPLSAPPEWTAHMGAAACADIVACAVRNPVEVLKVTLQAIAHVVSSG